MSGSWFEWILGGLFAVIWTGFGWIMNGMKSDIKQNEVDSLKNARDLADYKLHVSDNYPKESTISRLYETIEKMAEDISDLKVMVGRKS